MHKHLNKLFCRFDDLIEKHKVEKIKTIGSNYMCGRWLSFLKKHLGHRRRHAYIGHRRRASPHA